MDRLSQTISLRDGRALGFAEYGNPEGRPVLFFHGTPGSRLWAIPEWQDTSGPLRIIAPDRPGMGLSDFQPNRRIIDWPDDVEQLADALHLGRFAVAGVSGGGPHALACAYKLADRVTVTASLSGAAPIDGADALRGMHAGNRLAFSLAMRAPWLMGVLMIPNLYMAQYLPRLYTKVAAKGLPEADQRVLADERSREVAGQGAREAVRRGPRGVLQEARLYVQPWGFPLGAIATPVFIWQGTEDRNAPVEMARRLGAEIPGATVKIVEGQGHLMFATHWPEIAAVLSAPPSSTSSSEHVAE